MEKIFFRLVLIIILFQVPHVSASEDIALKFTYQSDNPFPTIMRTMGISPTISMEYPRRLESIRTFPKSKLTNLSLFQHCFKDAETGIVDNDSTYMLPVELRKAKPEDFALLLTLADTTLPDEERCIPNEMKDDLRHLMKLWELARFVEPHHDALAIIAHSLLNSIRNHAQEAWLKEWLQSWIYDPYGRASDTTRMVFDTLAEDISNTERPFSASKLKNLLCFVYSFKNLISTSQAELVIEGIKKRATTANNDSRLCQRIKAYLSIDDNKKSKTFVVPFVPNRETHTVQQGAFPISVKDLIDTRTVPQIEDRTLYIDNIRLPHIELDISKQDLTSLTGLEALDSLQNITELNLSSNNLTTIPDNIFAGLVALKILNLSHNRLTEITAHSFNLPTLQMLLIESNKLTKIPPCIFEKLPMLNFLDASCNQIEEISEDAFKGAGKLRLLHLSDNKISHIEPGTFRDCTSIIPIDLKNNNLTQSARCIKATVPSPNCVIDTSENPIPWYNRLLDRLLG